MRRECVTIPLMLSGSALPPASRQAVLVLTALVAALLAALALAGCGGTATVERLTTASPTAQPDSSANPSAPRSAASGKAGSAAPRGQLAPSRATTSLTTVRVAQLPKEAQTTLSLIAAGGPYPYSRDGVVFQNREGILPKRASGFYHEYTVATPGSSDRGARRVVTGDDGARFYTDDHYDSFSEVVSG